ncbi:MAG TPA: hydrogenase maturation protease [Tepidisphaeraceae bacterium]|jgi:hydrogenase maturation protease|nr:hydrogenase maturation protease [Tepidisphaeraceae bacterium]
MNQSMVDNIVRAVLYEGYILYPYRKSTKNEHRWTFGGIFPAAYPSEPHATQTQFLIRGDSSSRLSIRLQFLQAIEKKEKDWQEAIERSIPVDDLELGALTNELKRLPINVAPIEGVLEVSANQVGARLIQCTVKLVNTTTLDDRNRSRNDASRHAMLSANVIAAVQGGAFVSLIDPPAEFAAAAKECRNDRLWPVLIGEPGATDTILAAPIILYDYPEVAPESPGDLFDGTEIDEILSLRIMTLTDDEKRDAADLDERGAALLRRTETLAREQMMRLHGTMRPPRKVEAVHVGQSELRIGDHVRLNPRGSADAFDIILRGKLATIVAIEQDYENRIHLAVTIDDDPGADIGAAGKIGHRFFFGPDDVEPIESSEFRVQGSGKGDVAPSLNPEPQTLNRSSPPRILIACIGNIFLGDDAFGVHVAKKLQGVTFPPNVRVTDFGIRGIDLTYALLDSCDIAILVDAVPRGEAPGTVYVIEPDVSDGAGIPITPDLLEAHSMNPVKMLRAVSAMGGQVKRVLLLGCEPTPMDPDIDMSGDLSAPVAAAIDPAVKLLQSLVAKVSTEPLSMEVDHVQRVRSFA